MDSRNNISGAFDIGGTKCAALIGCLDENEYKILGKSRFPTSQYRDPYECIARLCGDLAALKKELDVDISAIGSLCHLFEQLLVESAHDHLALLVEDKLAIDLNRSTLCCTDTYGIDSDTLLLCTSGSLYGTRIVGLSVGNHNHHSCRIATL